mmetsp:Transcript_799/g.2483  ORF Transcript_799/g.2483 Transcript_799/m.2483 type:complete len:219 (+) Transcript_799:206-862(+)
MSVMPASSFTKSWPSAPAAGPRVLVMSCTRHSRLPALATRKVPGSISSLSLRPCSCAKASKASRTGAPTLARSVDTSVRVRATLNPPPRLSVSTVGIWRHSSSERPATRCQTAGSDPEPMWVCTLCACRPYRSTSCRASGRLSCQMPKLLEGPPTLVLPVEPEPRPGLKRRPMRAPGHASPKALSWAREQAFTTTPSLTSSATSLGSSWELRESSSGA